MEAVRVETLGIDLLARAGETMMAAALRLG